MRRQRLGHNMICEERVPLVIKLQTSLSEHEYYNCITWFIPRSTAYNRRLLAISSAIVNACKFRNFKELVSLKECMKLIF